VSTPELAATIGAGLGAGLPAGWAALRQLGRLVDLVARAVVALERIADRLETADYVKLPARGN
jgi:hypothetical protein